MGNIRAWPVLRTTDLDEALNLAEKLLSVASWYDPSGCHLKASTHTDDEVRRLTDALPDVHVSRYGKGGVGLPASLSAGADSIAKARESLGIWSGISRCYVLWHNMKWPPVPELGLNEEYKYAELQVAANSHTIHCEEWSAEHTVFVHARPGDDARPAWLAARVGSRVVGAAEFGW